MPGADKGDKSIAFIIARNEPGDGTRPRDRIAIAPWATLSRAEPRVGRDTRLTDDRILIRRLGPIPSPILTNRALRLQSATLHQHRHMGVHTVPPDARLSHGGIYLVAADADAWLSCRNRNPFSVLPPPSGTGTAFRALRACRSAENNSTSTYPVSLVCGPSHAHMRSTIRITVSPIRA